MHISPLLVAVFVPIVHRSEGNILAFGSMSKRRPQQSWSANSAVKRMTTLDTTSDQEVFFRATATAEEATCLTDGVRLASSSILPWIGFGTYKLGKEMACQAVLDALHCGYRQIDTAFIYGGETTERQVGRAIQMALANGIVASRRHLFVTTKHWRKYHGYEATRQCLTLSLKRLELDYVDLYLIHWPGPAYKTMNRRKDLIKQQGPWHYATQDASEMVSLRRETWRAMEDALQDGHVRSIGVSNFSVQHLEELKKTAKVWPPAVNQVEFHPLYPQPELLEYCRKEGIVLQAYASLGGQDTGKKQWDKLELEATTATEDAAIPLGGKRKPMKKKLRDTAVSLLTCRPVTDLARKLNVTPAQILLRWALSQNCAVIPKASSMERMKENADAMKFSLSQEEIHGVTAQIQTSRTKAASETQKLSEDDVEAIRRVGESALGRLCWRNDPFRHLDFGEDG